MAQIASIAPTFLIFLLTFGVSIGYMLYLAIRGAYTIDIGWHTLWIPASIFLIVLLIWGVTFITAPLNAMARDTQLTLRYVLTVAMVVSPVFYPIAQLNEELRFYMWYNPIACVLELYRWGLFHQNEPSWWHVALSCGVIFGIFMVGWGFFVRCEQRALEEM
jgi:ABC-type polysaccharide/polyol phosphate export permease